MQIKDKKNGKFICVGAATEEQLRDYFLSKINPEWLPDFCWEWPANKTKDGYGICKLYRKGEKPFGKLAHRFSYEYFNQQEIPKGLCVCHKCDNPCCVNPNHLFLGTHKDNSDDKVKKGRQPRGLAHSLATKAVIPRGEGHYKAKLTQDQVRVICEMRKTGMMYKEIAAIFDMETTSIFKICKGVRWTHVKREI